MYEFCADTEHPFEFPRDKVIKLVTNHLIVPFSWERSNKVHTLKSRAVSSQAILYFNHCSIVESILLWFSGQGLLFHSVLCVCSSYFII